MGMAETKKFSRFRQLATYSLIAQVLHEVIKLSLIIYWILSGSDEFYAFAKIFAFLMILCRIVTFFEEYDNEELDSRATILILANLWLHFRQYDSQREIGWNDSRDTFYTWLINRKAFRIWFYTLPTMILAMWAFFLDENRSFFSFLPIVYFVVGSFVVGNDVSSIYYAQCRLFKDHFFSNVSPFLVYLVTVIALSGVFSFTLLLINSGKYAFAATYYLPSFVFWALQISVLRHRSEELKRLAYIAIHLISAICLIGYILYYQLMNNSEEHGDLPKVAYIIYNAFSYIYFISKLSYLVLLMTPLGGDLSFIVIGHSQDFGVLMYQVAISIIMSSVRSEFPLRRIFEEVRIAQLHRLLFRDTLYNAGYRKQSMFVSETINFQEKEHEDNTTKHKSRRESERD